VKQQRSRREFDYCGSYAVYVIRGACDEKSLRRPLARQLFRDFSGGARTKKILDRINRIYKIFKIKFNPVNLVNPV
jgi:hypothetical protein